MRNQTIYEWVVEPVDEYGDILDPLYQATLADALECDISGFTDAVSKDIALVKHIGNEADGELERDYFYIRDGELQPNECGEHAPVRYRDQVKRKFKNI